MLELLRALPKQIEDALRTETPKIDRGKIEKIVFSGMGGSAIPGDIIESYLYDTELQLKTVRGYHLPGSVDKKTLVFSISYSGDTEETLSSYEEAKRRGAKIIAISSGGELEERARRDGILHLKIEKGLPPRFALGYLFGLPAKIICESFLPDKVEEIISLPQFLKKKVSEMEDLESGPRELAEKFYLRIPLIYSSPLLEPVAYRWCTQINENSKAFAHFAYLPELNHNELSGLKNPEEKLESFWIVFLKRKKEDKRIERRIEGTQELVKDSVLGISHVVAEGENLIQEIFFLVLYGDYLSYFLAQAYIEDPLSIPRIDELKRRLSE